MAPQPYFDASVIKVVYIIAVASGGYHDLPYSVLGGSFQKNFSSLMLLLVSFTMVFDFHPFYEFRSVYNYTRWNLPFGSARQVDYK